MSSPRGDMVAAGAYSDDDAGTDSGSAYVFAGYRMEEVQDVTMESEDPTTLSWTDLGAGVVYDMAGGLLSELRPAGEVYYYIVRAQHAR